MRFYKESSPADDLNIFPVYPSANRQVNIGSVLTIKWLSEVPAGNISSVKIEISRNNTSGPWTLIADQVKNNGQFQWTIPDTMASNEPCRIRFTVYSGVDSASKYSPQFFISPQNTVPVDLISFTASEEGSDIILKWETATETNNKGFDIERKSSGLIAWQCLGFIKAQGTSAEPHKYLYIDRDVLPGKYMYRLKQIDLDGSVNYSAIAEAEVPVIKTFSISQNYPNPFNPTTKITYTIPKTGRVTLKIYDVLGNEVLTLVNEVKPAGIYTVDFNAGTLTSGIYLYRISTKRHSVTKKMILIK